MFAKGRHSDLMGDMSQQDILTHYFGITKLPIVINSPLRDDKNPSLGLYWHNNKVMYKDFATGLYGDIVDLLQKIWKVSFSETLDRINREVPINYDNIKRGHHSVHINRNESKIEVKTRDWQKHDIEYWQSYGITLKWLKYAEVYPISHKIITCGNKRYIFSADKYAYVYVEHKEGITQLKIYQPFNKNGYKWTSKFDRSVISLWTKIPEKGDILILCSSVKDALCVWANTKIPCIAPQGEGYGISDTAINVLKQRYKNIYVLYDNDEPGIRNAHKICERTGFTYKELPKEYGEKDCSDLFKKLNNKEEFKKIITNLINS